MLQWAVHVVSLLWYQRDRTDNVGWSFSESLVHVILQRNKYLLTSCRKHVNKFLQK